jgi:ATP-dependent helicase/nuclease subunit A
LNKAIYPSQANWRRSTPAPGCPQFGPASVLDRPLEYDRQEEFSVRPGLVEPQQGTHKVVWWDPSKLTLNVDGGLGLRQKEILAEDGGASLAAYRAWVERRAERLAIGSKPEFEMFLASQAQEAPPDLIEVTTEIANKNKARPSGRRFGSLVHSILRDVALDAGATSIARIAELTARSIGAPSEETTAARAAVEAVLVHPILSRARAAKRCHREYPVTLQLDGARLLEGIIDLAFVEDGAWIIVDFKTDADSSGRREQYERQLQWYAYALTKLTGMPARAHLLSV